MGMHFYECVCVVIRNLSMHSKINTLKTVIDIHLYLATPVSISLQKNEGRVKFRVLTTANFRLKQGIQNGFK